MLRSFFLSRVSSMMKTCRCTTGEMPYLVLYLNYLLDDCKTSMGSRLRHALKALRSSATRTAYVSFVHALVFQEPLRAVCYFQWQSALLFIVNAYSSSICFYTPLLYSRINLPKPEMACELRRVQLYNMSMKQ